MPDEASTSTVTLIRNEPVQARSTARLGALLDAAAAVTAEIGYERLTTAMVAERAGASIGTVYRYFPDRIAVLQALAARNLERVTELVREAVREPGAADWRAALDVVYDRVADAFRSEPGFASLRLGDVLDLRPWKGPRGNDRLGLELADLLADRFGLELDEELKVTAIAAVETMDAALARAFRIDDAGDPRTVGFGRNVLHCVLAEREHGAS